MRAVRFGQDSQGWHPLPKSSQGLHSGGLHWGQ